MELIEQKPKKLLLISFFIYLFSFSTILIIFVNYHSQSYTPNEVVIKDMRKDDNGLINAVLELKESIVLKDKIQNLKLLINGNEYFLKCKIVKKIKIKNYQISFYDEHLDINRDFFNGIIFTQKVSTEPLYKDMIGI